MSGINFTGDISLGQLIPLAVILVGAIGGYFTLRGKVSEVDERARKAESKASALEGSLNEFKLKAVETFVQANDLREVKEDLVREMHVVRNALMAALQSVSVGSTPRRRSGAE